MLDGYGNPNKGVGFFPNSIPDLNNTWESIENGTAQLNFTRIKDNYKMRTAAKARRNYAAYAGGIRQSKRSV